MNVSVIPSWFCPLKCNYCFVDDIDKKDKRCIDLSKLALQLKEIEESFSKIISIDIFGGEPSLYKEIDDLLDVCVNFTSNISIVSNLYDTKIIDYCNLVDLSVSLNPSRSDFKRSIKIIRSLSPDVSKHIRITSVAIPDVINNPESFLEIINSLNVKSVSFLQYYKSINSKVAYDVSNNEYVLFNRRVAELFQTNDYNFEFENINRFNHFGDPHINNHIFISPNNQYGTVNYNKNNEEYFVWVNSLDEYNVLVSKEKIEMFNQCGLCQYYKNCYAEHLHKHNINDCCCGLKPLLENPIIFC